MSHELVDEVLKWCRSRDDLTPAERLVLVVIAERSQDADRVLSDGRYVPARTCFPTTEELARTVGVKPAGLRRVFQRLRDRGLEVRRPMTRNGKPVLDKSGNPLYAVPGQAPEFCLPHLTVEGRTQVRPIGQTQVRGRADAGPGQGGRESAPNQKQPEATAPLPPQRSDRRPAPARQGRGGDDVRTYLVGEHGLTPDRADAVIAYASTDPTTTSSWQGRLRAPGYVDAVLAELAKAEAEQTRHAVTALRQGPECEHGAPGGRSIHPTSGEPLCPLCRITTWGPPSQTPGEGGRSDGGPPRPPSDATATAPDVDAEVAGLTGRLRTVGAA